MNWQDRTNPRAGGAEVHLHEIFGRLATRGHQVHLLCSGYDGAASQETLDGIHVHRVSSRYGFALAGRGAFRELVGRLTPDLVVEDVNKVPLNLPSLWAGPFVLLVPHLFGATAFREVPWPVAAVVWLAERPMPRVYARAGVHAISASTRDDLVGRGFRADSVQVIHPGVDSKHFVPDPAVSREAAPTFLYVGRLARYKQVEVAVRAVRLVRGRGMDARLWVAGTGADRGRLERIARAEGVAGAVEFKGYVSEEKKIELYRRVWGVVLPSLKEGWGITNLEAAACGTPALAADNSALRESVWDGETGYLFATGDPAACAQAMTLIAEDPERRARMCLTARAFAESFSWDRCAESTENHLAAVTAAWPRG